MALETRINNGSSLPFIPSNHTSPPIETHEIPITLEQRPKGRQRSNSKVYNNTGSSSFKENQTIDHLNNVSITSASQQQQLNKPKKHFERESHLYILSLISLNGTFDRKTLKIPEHPSVLKLGRPTNAQRTPNIYNGYFDSRVISREHAEIYIKNGKVFINDLKSANGTFLNGEAIHVENELKVGDMFDLGIDISNDNKHQHQQQQHLKITCRVEGFLSFPLDGITDTKKLLENINKDFNKQNKDSSLINDEDNIEKNPKLSLFDAAMFGDVNNDLEDVELGLNHDYLTGIFVNNNIGTSSNLIQSIKILIDQVHSVKMNNMKLESIETFLQDYKSYINKDKKLLNSNDLNRDKAEIEKLETKLKKLDSLLILKENENKQSNLNLLASNSKIKEIEKNKNELTNIKDSLTQETMTLKATIQEKDSLIIAKDNLFESKLNDSNDKIKILQDEIKQKDELILILAKEKEQQVQKNQLYNDLAKLSLIIIVVLVVGVTTLKVF